MTAEIEQGICHILPVDGLLLTDTEAIAVMSGLASKFTAWWENEDTEESISNGLIVLDANTLLHLYRVTPAAREQVLNALHEFRGRLWVPHQAALEFHRNRINAVKSRVSQFSNTMRSLERGLPNAISEISKAVAQLETLREANGTHRAWESSECGLDTASLNKRLDGLMKPALDELAELTKEHDLGPKEVDGNDQILERLEEITSGRIGDPFSVQELHGIVREAVDFRFPNKIPPGYEDAPKKSTPYFAAGDYILWRQIMDRATRDPKPTHMVLVTDDTKEDWWILDKSGKPVKARPELKQELFEHSGVRIVLQTLSSFLSASQEHVSDKVSDQTLMEVKASETAIHHEDEVAHTSPDDIVEDAARIGLRSYSHREFEQLVTQLFDAMGFETETFGYRDNPGLDILATASTSPLDATLVAVKVLHSERPVLIHKVRSFYGALMDSVADRGVIITSSWFSRQAKLFALDKPIKLIDGSELVEMLHLHLGLKLTDGR